ncbi:hypothetical protein KFL_005890050, partial [Klebsormidium nitens]
MVKKQKEGKIMNPTDAHRKMERRKELQRNKKERMKVREVGVLKKDPNAIKAQIDKLEQMQADGALDKTRRHKKRQLEESLDKVVKKQKEYEEKMREKGEEPVMFSHLAPPKPSMVVPLNDVKVAGDYPRPEDSVYYHPELNPQGLPPGGKPQMYRARPVEPIPSPAKQTDAPPLALPIPPPPKPPAPK